MANKLSLMRQEAGKCMLHFFGPQGPREILRKLMPEALIRQDGKETPPHDFFLFLGAG